MSPVFRWPVHWQCLLPAADHSRADNHPPGPSGSFLTPATHRGVPPLQPRTSWFNPAPLLNSVDAPRLPPRAAPSAATRDTAAILKAIWRRRKKKRKRKKKNSHLGQHSVKSGWRSACSSDLDSQNVNKTRSNISSAYWESQCVQQLETVLASFKAEAHSSQCDWLYVNMIFNIRINGCTWVLNIDMLISLGTGVERWLWYRWM